MVPFPQAKRRIARPLPVQQLLLDFPRHGVLAVIDPGAKRRTGFEESGLQARFRQRVCGYPAAGPAPNHANIEGVHRRSHLINWRFLKIWHTYGICEPPSSFPIDRKSVVREREEIS